MLSAHVRKEISYKHLTNQKQPTFWADVALSALGLGLCACAMAGPAPTAAPAPQNEPLKTGWPGPADVQVVFQDINGRPLAGAVGYAYCPELGVTQFFEKHGKGPATAGGPGIYKAKLFAGNWQIFGFCKGDGGGTFVSKYFANIKNGDTLAIKPDRRVTLSFRNNKSGLDVDTVIAMDSRYARWMNCIPTGSSRNGRFELSTTSESPLDLVCWKSPQSEAGVLLTGHVAASTGPDTVFFDLAQTGRLRVEASAEAPTPTSAELVLTLPGMLSVNPFKMTAALPFEVCVTPGVIEASYTYRAGQQCDLEFYRKGHTVTAGQTKTLRLGGPYEYSIYHDYGRRRWEKFNRLKFQLFIRDVNGSILSPWLRPGGKELLDAPFEIKSGERVITRGSLRQLICARGGPFESDPDVLSSAADLDTVEYRFALPFENGPQRVIKGHGIDFRKASEHYLFLGPHETSESADIWLNTAETSYRACTQVMGTPIFNKPKNREIRFLPRTLTCAPGADTHFSAVVGLKISTPTRIFETAVIHEIIHTFGVPDGEYRLHIGQAVCELIPECGILSRREGGGGAWGMAIIACLRGESLEGRGFPVSLGLRLHVAHQILGSRFGFRIFADQLAKSRQVAKTLSQEGIPDEVIDCALLDSLTNGQAYPIFKAAGIDLPQDKLEKARSILSPSPTAK